MYWCMFHRWGFPYWQNCSWRTPLTNIQRKLNVHPANIRCMFTQCSQLKCSKHCSKHSANIWRTFSKPLGNVQRIVGERSRNSPIGDWMFTQCWQLRIRDRSDALINNAILDLSVYLGFYTYAHKTIYIYLHQDVYFCVYINKDCAP